MKKGERENSKRRRARRAEERKERRGRDDYRKRGNAITRETGEREMGSSREIESRDRGRNRKSEIV